ncbi:hypothetical protein Tco_0798550 [Tanacetum coccineum]
MRSRRHRSLQDRHHHLQTTCLVYEQHLNRLCDWTYGDQTHGTTFSQLCAEPEYQEYLYIDAGYEPIEDSLCSSLMLHLQLFSPRLVIPSPPLPLPSPPIHTSPTYAEAPLGYKAPEIRLRAASSSTHHLSDIPSPPLLLPSTYHRDGSSRGDTDAFRKRLVLCSLSRFEVGESSSAAAARQAGHTLAHRRRDTFARSFFYNALESYYTQQAWSHSESRIQAMEALIRDLQRDVIVTPGQGLEMRSGLTTSQIQHET